MHKNIEQMEWIFSTVVKLYIQIIKDTFFMQGFFIDGSIIFVISSVKTKRLDILTKACMMVSW